MLKTLAPIFFLASALSGETYSVIRGTVTDIAGAPVANAQVYLQIYHDGHRYTTTDAMGRYLFTHVGASGGFSFMVTVERKKPGATGFYNRMSNQKGTLWIDIKVAEKITDLTDLK